MAGRRQVWAGITLFLLTLALPTSMLALSRLPNGWEAATLIATAILLSLCAQRARIVVLRLSTAAGSVIGPATSGPPVLSRLAPDAPGRPMPRAPGRACRAYLA
ncbi:MAG TPA: hypothetical protein VLL08_28290 [Kineosporiaceae bacterium]|nr:hypothetical protein [Kineosporiaceae bacterium]